MNERNGPEFIPLRNYIKECKILVLLCDADKKEIRREIMDYGSSEDRVWLGKLSFFAWQQGWSVITSLINK